MWHWGHQWTGKNRLYCHTLPIYFPQHCRAFTKMLKQRKLAVKKLNFLQWWSVAINIKIRFSLLWSTWSWGRGQDSWLAYICRSGTWAVIIAVVQPQSFLTGLRFSLKFRKYRKKGQSKDISEAHAPGWNFPWNFIFTWKTNNFCHCSKFAKH